MDKLKAGLPTIQVLDLTIQKAPEKI